MAGTWIVICVPAGTGNVVFPPSALFTVKTVSSAALLGMDVTCDSMSWLA